MIVALPLGLIDALLTLALAVGAYFFWCLLLRWMTQGYIGRLIWTICGNRRGLMDSVSVCTLFCCSKVGR